MEPPDRVRCPREERVEFARIAQLGGDLTSGGGVCNLRVLTSQRGMGARCFSPALLFAWRNDPLTRAMSIATGKVAREQATYGFVDAEERGVHLLRCERRIVPFGT